MTTLSDAARLLSWAWVDADSDEHLFFACKRCERTNNCHWEWSAPMTSYLSDVLRAYESHWMEAHT